VLLNRKSGTVPPNVEPKRGAPNVGEGTDASRVAQKCNTHLGLTPRNLDSKNPSQPDPVFEAKTGSFFIFPVIARNEANPYK